MSTPRSRHALLAQHIVAYRVDGALFFGAAQRFLLELTEIADVEVVILRLGGVRVLDSTGAQALADLIVHLQDREVTVLLASLRPEHRLLLQRAGVLDVLVHENHVVPTIGEALIHARRHVVRSAHRFGRPPRELHRAAPVVREVGAPSANHDLAEFDGVIVGAAVQRRGAAMRPVQAATGSGLAVAAGRIRVSGATTVSAALRVAWLGSARRKTFFHAEATCLGSGPLV